MPGNCWTYPKLGHTNESVDHYSFSWSTESACRVLGHFNHRLSSKRGRESLDSEASRLDQDDTRLNLAEGLPSGRTSAPYDTANKASSLELRGFLQINNGQMVAPG
jgi:hypothetical protein